MSTIAHISDLHLQSGVPARQAQVEPILQKINAMKPDLVVISGDVTDDGWDSIEELKWAKAWLDERIEAPQMVLPGNHDVGNFISQPEGQTNTSRVSNWGHCYTCPIFMEVGPWYVFGINSMILGSGLEAEHTQIQWLEDALVSADRFGAIAAVFLHSPLFVNSHDELQDPQAEYWLGLREARAKLMERLYQSVTRLVGSGHVHQTRLTDVDGVKIAWAPPASGTWVHAPGLPNPPMPKQTGFFLHHLHDDGRVDSELIECAPMLKLY